MPDEENKNNTDLEQTQTTEPLETTTETTSTPEETTPEPVVTPAPAPEPAVVAPVAEPAPAAATTAPTPVTPSTAGVLVLQWLTYAFWGWLILALIWLVLVILVNAILNESVSEMIPYAIAASIVLLPLAYGTNHFYTKQEALKKTGGSAVIMIIHAVIFAIFGIMTLIIAVFTAINFAINTESAASADWTLITLLTAVFATILYAAAFLRTLNPFKSTKPLRIYSIAMLSVTVLLLVLGVVGPLAKEFSTRNDRLIEDNLSSVENSIASYVSENDKLPNSLSDLTLNSPEATQLIENKLVEYKKEDSVTKETLFSTTTEHRYQLCVTYAEAKSSSGYSLSYRINPDIYTSYVTTSSHGSGKECYKLKTATDSYKSNDNTFELEQ